MFDERLAIWEDIFSCYEKKNEEIKKRKKKKEAIAVCCAQTERRKEGKREVKQSGTGRKKEIKINKFSSSVFSQFVIFVAFDYLHTQQEFRTVI